MSLDNEKGGPNLGAPVRGARKGGKKNTKLKQKYNKKRKLNRKTLELLK
jgi:hypothetical protein